MRPSAPILPVLTLSIRNEADVVLVRQRARTVAELLGLPSVDQTRVATAVSEIARNALVHGRGGAARFSAGGTPPAMHVAVEDRGTGLGASGWSLGDGTESGGEGLVLSRRLMDTFEIADAEGGAHGVRMSKYLPHRNAELRGEDVQAVVAALMTRPPESLLEELHQQHQELLAVLEDLTRQQESLRAANRELEATNRGVMALYNELAQELDDTNRGVVALYAQLDDQAEELRRVSGLKDRFLSHLSHEFRTPLNSTLALSRLLLDRVDGPLTDEQAIQVGFVRKGAQDLLAMVNDLLDIAKIESGRMEVRVDELPLEELMGSLRGMLRPMAVERGLELDIHDPPRGAGPLRSDGAKLSQILRNLVANAIKYTPEGVVRLRVEEEEGSEHVLFVVEDTGVGIAPEDMDRVFRDFEQARLSPRPVTEGTGLGLPISRELSRLLGGELTAESRLGEGSVFRLRIPRILADAAGRASDDPAAPEGGTVRDSPERPSRAGLPATRAAAAATDIAPPPTDAREPVVLVIDDDAASRYVVEHTLEPSGIRVTHAVTGAEGLAKARAHPPRAIFLDVGLPDGSGFEILRELERIPELARCPIIIYTCREVDREQARTLSGFALHVVHKADPELRGTIAGIAEALVGSGPSPERSGP